MATDKLVANPAAFQCQREPEYLKERLRVWQELKLKVKGANSGAHVPITITHRCGPRTCAHDCSGETQTAGVAFETTPLDLVPKLSKQEQERNPFIVARVFASGGSEEKIVDADDDSDLSDAEGTEDAHAHLAEFLQDHGPSESYVLWDLNRPLEQTCRLELVRFDEQEGQDVFWHSSAHILGQVLELEFGGYLTIGPALKTGGFYYDMFMGDRKINEDDLKSIEKSIQKHVQDITKPDYASKFVAGDSSMTPPTCDFERMIISKEDALRLFAYNPFKQQLIKSKIPDGTSTSCYRCGSLIDLCRGPHIPDMKLAGQSSKSRQFALHKHGQAYWLGKDTGDSLQRIYGISFPSQTQLKDWEEKQEDLKKRKHQLIGQSQDLFFFHEKFSPGCCFWMPHGTRIFNKLCDWMRSEQRLRGFTEVITPNMFRCDIFKCSAHYWTYPERYSLDNENEEWMLKPMNCPAHCIIFRHKPRSYKELPIRICDFGVLHRKELSGALTGLTRVRRFQQDDGHIFCRFDQIPQELELALDFMKYIYSELGMKYSFVLSTRPAKALGKKETWNEAECALARALNNAGVNWKVNKGDGAFYGPKIDVLIEDIYGKGTQCATIQLDFQLPTRFDLQYDDRRNEAEGQAAQKEAETAREPKGSNEEEKELYVRQHGMEGPLKPGFSRPVLIHRAVFGSLERFTAMLSEHTAGKWPFFLNPRQVMVVPVAPAFNRYCEYVATQMRKVGTLYADSNTSSGGKMEKKIKLALEAGYSFVAVVGEQDQHNLTVTLRRGVSSLGESEERLMADLMQGALGDSEQRITLPLATAISILKNANFPCSQKENTEKLEPFDGMDPNVAIGPVAVGVKAQDNVACRAGGHVQVKSPFQTDSEPAQKLSAGQHGVIQCMQDGWAQIDFSGVEKLQWVEPANLYNLAVQAS